MTTDPPKGTTSVPLTKPGDEAQRWEREPVAGAKAVALPSTKNNTMAVGFTIMISAVCETKNNYWVLVE